MLLGPVHEGSQRSFKVISPFVTLGVSAEMDLKKLSLGCDNSSWAICTNGKKGHGDTYEPAIPEVKNYQVVHI